MQQSQPSPSTTLRLVKAQRFSPLCLVAFVAGGCTVDLSHLRGGTSGLPDGSADAGVDVETSGAWSDAEEADGSVTVDGPAAPDLTPTSDLTLSDDVKVIAGQDSPLADDGGPSPDTASGGGDIGATTPDVGNALDESSDVSANEVGGDGADSGAGAVGGAGGAGAGDANDGAGGIGGGAGSDAADSGSTGGDALDGNPDGAGRDSRYAGDAAGDVSTDGPGGSAGVDPDLVLWYQFDESSGTVVHDSSLVGGHDGTLGTAGTGSATFTTDCQVGTHALSLVSPSSLFTSAGGYVTVPAPESLAPDAVTIAIWVKLTAATSAQDWERIYDFGTGSTGIAFFYLTARASDATNIPVRFGISNTGHTAAAEQRLEGTSALSANVWHHIAVVLPSGTTYTGTLYIDGVAVATNSAMTLHLSNIPATTLNWLGRSPFTNDPYFYGSLDDFRIYKRALSATEISALIAIR